MKYRCTVKDSELPCNNIRDVARQKLNISECIVFGSVIYSVNAPVGLSAYIQCRHLLERSTQDLTVHDPGHQESLDPSAQFSLHALTAPVHPWLGLHAYMPSFYIRIKELYS
jgi:hypothetical protein